MTQIRTLSTIAPAQRKCPLCQTPLDRSHPDACPNCDWVSGYRRHMEELRSSGSGRDLTAAVLSILPGAGHFYKGHVAAGLAALAGLLAACLFVAGTVVATVGAATLLLPAYMLAVAMHAYWAEDLAFERRMAGSRKLPLLERFRSFTAIVNRLPRRSSFPSLQRAALRPRRPTRRGLVGAAGALRPARESAA